MSEEGAEFKRPSLPDRKKKSGGFQSMGKKTFNSTENKNKA